MRCLKHIVGTPIEYRFRSDYISSGLRYFVGKNIETRCQVNWSWRMSGKDKPDKMERKLDLGILKPVPIHLFPIIILTLSSQKVFLVYSKIKKNYQGTRFRYLQVLDEYIYSYPDIQQLIRETTESFNKLSSHFSRRERGNWGMSFSLVFHFLLLMLLKSS